MSRTNQKKTKLKQITLTVSVWKNEFCRMNDCPKKALVLVDLG